MQTDDDDSIEKFEQLLHLASSVRIATSRDQAIKANRQNTEPFLY